MSFFVQILFSHIRYTCSLFS